MEEGLGEVGRVGVEIIRVAAGSLPPMAYEKGMEHWVKGGMEMT